MRRLFTLAALVMVMAMSANAQDAIRKSWDFREGFSTKTINALNADMAEYGVNTHWRNYESVPQRLMTSFSLALVTLLMAMATHVHGLPM